MKFLFLVVAISFSAANSQTSQLLQNTLSAEMDDRQNSQIKVISNWMRLSVKRGIGGGQSTLVQNNDVLGTASFDAKNILTFGLGFEVLRLKSFGIISNITNRKLKYPDLQTSDDLYTADINLAYTHNTKLYSYAGLNATGAKLLNEFDYYKPSIKSGYQAGVGYKVFDRLAIEATFSKLKAAGKRGAGSQASLEAEIQTLELGLVGTF